MKISQAQKNLVEEILAVNEKCNDALKIFFSNPKPLDRAEDCIDLAELAEDSLMLSLHLREYLRPKSIVESKGQRA